MAKGTVPWLFFLPHYPIRSIYPGWYNTVMVTNSLLASARRSRPRIYIPILGIVFLLVLLAGFLTKYMVGKVAFLDNLLLKIDFTVPYLDVHLYGPELMNDYLWVLFCLPGTILIFILTTIMAHRKKAFSFLAGLESLSSFVVILAMLIIVLLPKYFKDQYMQIVLQVYKYGKYAFVGIHGLACVFAFFDPWLIAPKYREIYKLRRVRLMRSKQYRKDKKTFKKLFAKRKYHELCEFLYEPYIAPESNLKLTPSAIEYLVYSGAETRKGLEAIRLTQMARSGQTMGMKIEVAANKAELKRLSGDQYYVDPKTVPPFLSQYGKKGPAEISPNTPSKKQIKQMKKAEKKAEKERRKVSHKAYKAAKKQGKVY